MNELEPVAAHVEAMRRAYGEIESARTIDEVKDIRDRAAALLQYAKAAEYSRDITNRCAEILLKAERRAGELLTEMPKQAGARGIGKKVESQPATPLPPKLDDIGITKTQSSRWQQLASIPDEVFDDYVETVNKSDGDELITRSGLKQHAARQRQPDPVPEPVPLPDGKFSCIVSDPPWPMQKIERTERPAQGVTLDYPVMSLEDIAALPVADLAADDCHLYLWVTHKFLPAGMDLLEEWGFRYQCVMTWRKNVGITPFSWMYDTEHVIFARRGNLPLTQLGLRLSFEAPVQGHSVKPDVFYERVTAASPGPRLEMFSRRKRDGFEVWGNEVANAD